MQVIGPLKKMTVLASCVGALLLASTHADAARIKCWKNNDGVRECGNVVPPEFAQKGHSEVNRQGVTLKRKKRALTEEEKIEREAKRKAEQQAKLEEAKRRNEELRRRNRQAAADRTLLDLYVTEKDLELAHGRKIEAIESTIKHRRQHMSRLEEQLAKYQKLAADKERGGQKVDENTLGTIQSVQRQIDDNERFIRKRHEDIDELDGEYLKDLDRYRFLKAGGEVGSPPEQSS